MILFKYFWVNRLFFVRERAIHSEKMSDLLRLLFCHEQPVRFVLSHSFLVSDLSKSLTVAHFGEWPERFAHLLIFGEQPERFAHSRSFLVNDLSEWLHGCSFLVSDLSDSLTSLIKKREWALVCFFKRIKSVPKNMVLVKTFFANRSFAHLSWATWANRSRWLICHEWPEQYAHGRSFDMSDLSDLHSWASLNEI